MVLVDGPHEKSDKSKKKKKAHAYKLQYLKAAKLGHVILRSKYTNG